MKLVLIILLTFLFQSCNNEKHDYAIVYTKFSKSFLNKPLDNNWCRYYYINQKGNHIEFMEKCDKYNIGDTIYKF